MKMLQSVAVFGVAALFWFAGQALWAVAAEQRSKPLGEDFWSVLTHLLVSGGGAILAVSLMAIAVLGALVVALTTCIRWVSPSAPGEQGT